MNNDNLQGLYNLYIDKCKLINCGTDCVLKSMHETSNTFWKDTLNAYIELCKKYKFNSFNILYYPLFYNSDEQSIYLNLWFKASVHCIGDIVNSSSRTFVNIKDFKLRYNFNVNYVTYMSVITAVKNFST